MFLKGTLSPLGCSFCPNRTSSLDMLVQTVEVSSIGEYGAGLLMTGRKLNINGEQKRIFCRSFTYTSSWSRIVHSSFFIAILAFSRLSKSVITLKVGFRPRYLCFLTSSGFLNGPCGAYIGIGGRCFVGSGFSVTKVQDGSQINPSLGLLLGSFFNVLILFGTF